MKFFVLTGINSTSIPLGLSIFGTKVEAGFCLYMHIVGQELKIGIQTLTLTSSGRCYKDL